MAGLAFNLAGVSSYTEEQPFLDIMKISRPFTGAWSTLTHQQLVDGSYLDAAGWPIAIPAGGSGPIRTVWESTSIARSGSYILTWEGTGTLSMNNCQSVTTLEPNRVAFTTLSGGDQFWLDITATNAAPNNVRNIKIVRTEHESLLTAGEMFNPAFLSFFENSGASGARFMDWMQTNGSSQSEWADRPLFDYSTWARGKGVPLEVMVALANRLGIDPWFTFPHLATDEYIEEFAAYVRDNLDDGLVARYEWSNETWNTAFGQTTYCQSQGTAAGWTTGTTSDKGNLWAGYKMAQASELVRAVYGTDSGNGWEGVLATWPDVPYHTEKRLDGIDYHIANDAGVPVGTTVAKLFSDIAVTTYFGSGMLADSTRRVELVSYFGSHTAEECYAWVNQKMLDPTYETGGSIPYIAEKWAEQKVIAVANGLTLSSYEGGTHIVHLFGLEASIPTETRNLIYPILIEHDNRPEMAELYAASWDAWEAITDGPYTHYYSIVAPSNYGTWGAKRSLNADITGKWAALSSKSRGLPYQPSFVGVTANVSA